MTYMEQMLEDLSTKAGNILRQNEEHTDQLSDHISAQFRNAHDDAGQIYDMLAKVSEQMKINNAFQAIALQQQFEAQGKELPPEYAKLTQKAIEDAIPAKHLEGRGTEFDEQFGTAEQGLPDFILE